MDHCCATVSILDVCIRLLPRADAIEEIHLVTRVRKAAVLFRGDLLLPIRWSREHLPAASVAAKKHEPLRPVELDARRVLLPQGEQIAAADLGILFEHVVTVADLLKMDL